MGISPRVPVLAALAVVPLVLATGCGSEATGTRTTLATVQNTSYVVEAPVPTTVPPPTQPTPGVAEGQVDPNEQQYTVASGDSVSKIASLFGVDAVVLANYNAWPEGIQHPIFPGDVIKIPPGSKVPGTGSTDSGASTGGDTGSTDTSPDTPDSADTTAPSGEIACEHTVVEGDNPSRLADKYGVTLDELSNANVSNAAYTRFLIGDKINIPAGGDC